MQFFGQVTKSRKRLKGNRVTSERTQDCAGPSCSSLRAAKVAHFFWLGMTSFHR